MPILPHPWFVCRTTARPQWPHIKWAMPASADDEPFCEKPEITVRLA